MDKWTRRERGGRLGCGENKLYIETEKYNLISTHTARSTFVTLSSYRGASKLIVKSVTGHGSDKMVDKYFKKDTESSKKAIEAVFDFLKD